MLPRRRWWPAHSKCEPTRVEQLVDDRPRQFDGAVEITEPDPLLREVDVDNRHHQLREPLLHGSFADLRKQVEAGFTLRTVPMDQGDTAGGSS